MCRLFLLSKTFSTILEGDVLNLSEEAQGQMKEIQALENKYGLIPFRMSMVNLFEVGRENFDDDSTEKWLEQIQAEEDEEKTSGKRSCVRPDFKRHILQCTVELAKFSSLTLFAYIKKHFVIDI